ncbi:MAG: sugar ABC transporter ATP-binding protein [Candidatus Latescibacterota bacterium]|nr:sugar ABC transporter ATP-binding protein [Candidatus Latescibacterota bacterium]
MKDSILKLSGINKSFPGVHALKGVDFDLLRGEIHALVGENGAGKSTLIKIASGVYIPDSGCYAILGEEVRITGPMDAIALGIVVVYQELEIVPSLSVAENIFFGQLPNRFGRVQWDLLYKESEVLLKRVGLEIDPRELVSSFGVGAQQLVEIARALACNARVIIMDEPTSALSPAEVENVFRIIQELKSNGVSIVYVSHKLDEVLSVSDRVTVYRDGSRVGTWDTVDLDEPKIIRHMVGRDMDINQPHKRRIKSKKCLLEVNGLSTDNVSNLNFEVGEGEIIGFSGLMGSGRSEMVRALLGLDGRRGGSIKVEEKILNENSPRRARELGLGVVPEDRRIDGIFPHLSVRDNASISSLSRFSELGRIKIKKEYLAVNDLVGQLKVRTPNLHQKIAKLSGGNQQKVLIARWLLVQNLKVLVVDEPTRGIDIGAKDEIYRLLNNLANEGIGVVVCSSEMNEVINLSDRIYVMCDGMISCSFSRAEATPERLLASSLPSGFKV